MPNIDGGDGNMERASPKQPTVIPPPPAGMNLQPPPPHVIPSSLPMPPAGAMDTTGPPGSGQFQDSYLTFLKVPGMLTLNAMRLLNSFLPFTFS